MSFHNFCKTFQIFPKFLHNYFTNFLKFFRKYSDMYLPSIYVGQGHPHTTQSPCNSDSVRHSLVSTSNMSRRLPTHESTSIQFGLRGVSESQRLSHMWVASITFGIHLKFPKNFLNDSRNNHSQKFLWNFNINTTRTRLTWSLWLMRLASRLYTQLRYSSESESNSN